MRDFTQILADLDHGDVGRQCTEQLAELVRAVCDTGKKGAFVLTLSIAPEGDMAIVEAKVATKTPKAATNKTILYSTSEGELRLDDPNQAPLKTIKAAANSALRTVPEKAAVAHDAE